ncbi:MAG: 3-oxoacyl-ACP reductase family protein [Thermodesulfobacteriota bacterium]
MRLKDQVAIVTGASRGIGRGIALKFAQEGAHLVVNYQQNREAAREVAAAVEALGRQALIVQTDVSRRSEGQRLIQETADFFGRIDILVNNAAILQQKPFAEITDADWEAMFGVCLKGPFILSQEILPHFKARKQGCIINVASIGGQLGGPKAPHYSAAKAGLICFTKSTARIMAPYGVRVNCISPGLIETDMSSREIGMMGGPETVGATIPLARVGAPADIAGAAVFLASEDATYITGQTINVNGGLFFS